MYTKINKIRYIEQESYKGSMQWVIVGFLTPIYDRNTFFLHEIYFNRIFDTKMKFSEIVDYKK